MVTSFVWGDIKHISIYTRVNTRIYLDPCRCLGIFAQQGDRGAESKNKPWLCRHTNSSKFVLCKSGGRQALLLIPTNRTNATEFAKLQKYFDTRPERFRRFLNYYLRKTKSKIKKKFKKLHRKYKFRLSETYIYRKKRWNFDYLARIAKSRDSDWRLTELGIPTVCRKVV